MAVVLISSDAIDAQMAGPGIRYWEFARHLSQHHEVILLTPNVSSLSHPHVEMVQLTPHALKMALRRAEVVVTQGFMFHFAPLFLQNAPVVVDLSFPLSVELLEHHSHLPLREASLSYAYCVERTKMLLLRGDFFLYSHEHQRDYWLGMLTAIGRVTPSQYRHDPSLSRWFGCVPFGLSSEPPTATRPVFHGDGAILPQQQIDPEKDTILLWGGGLWRWFDPCAVIRAMGDISQTRRDIKLLFICGKRPHHQTTGVNVAYVIDEAMALSQELGVYNETVFFNHAWVPYQDRGSYFREVDIGISTHFDNLETRFSFRTRILDYLWAELPIIATKGDYFSDIIDEHELGITVDPKQPEQIKAAILRMTDEQGFRERCRANIRRVRQQFEWEAVMQPLVRFCRSPYQTNQLSRLEKWFWLARFYGTTGKILLQYQGYHKLFQKIRQAFQASHRN